MSKHLSKTKERETEELLLSLQRTYRYNPQTGSVLFRFKSLGGNPRGSKAGYIEADGYVRLTHKGKRYPAHRVAWALHYGHWPEHTIDHINRVKSDNRICNLRDVTQLENNQNKGRYRK